MSFVAIRLSVQVPTPTREGVDAGGGAPATPLRRRRMEWSDCCAGANAATLDCTAANRAGNTRRDDRILASHQRSCRSCNRSVGPGLWLWSGRLGQTARPDVWARTRLARHVFEACWLGARASRQKAAAAAAAAGNAHLHSRRHDEERDTADTSLKMEKPTSTRRRPWAAIGLFAVTTAAALAAPAVVRRQRQQHGLRRLGHVHHSDDKEDVPLIEFAVTGFAKTGTSYLLHHVLNTPETFMGGEEHCLSSSDVTKKISMYKPGEMMADGRTRIKNGLKCPRDLQDVHGLENYEKHFPRTKFIVSLRHPILWFQSFYNYKVRQHALKKHDAWRPNVMDLIGPCNAGSEYVTHTYQKGETHREGVCTNAARFHHYLSRLGFTDMSTPEERSLVDHGMAIASLPKAELFLMEINQFSIENQTRADEFTRDLQEYIGLETPLPPLLAHEKKKIPEDVQNMFIDICDEQYDLIRSMLLETAREAHVWIRDYFLKSDQVFVSSPEHFLELLEGWDRDPCVDEDG